MLSVSVPRVATEDLIVHVRLDDGWHRLDPTGLETACDLQVNGRLQIETRHSRRLEHPLARCECWTRKEREKADATYLEKFGSVFTY